MNTTTHNDIEPGYLVLSIEELREILKKAEKESTTIYKEVWNLHNTVIELEINNNPECINKGRKQIVYWFELQKRN